MLNATNNETRKKEQLYLRSWEYNAALILDELEKMILSKGGQIVSTWDIGKQKRYLIINRSLRQQISEQQKRVEIMTRNNRPGAEEAQKELERLQAIPNKPRESRNGSFLYLTFAFEGVYYSYNMNDNPFFDFSFSKIKIVNDCIEQDRYSIKDKKEWFEDCLWGFNCTEAKRKEIAQKILDMLISSRFSQPYNGGRRVEKLYILEDGKQ